MTADNPPIPEERPVVAVAAAPKREVIPYTYTGEEAPGALYMTTGAFDQLQRVAALMSKSQLVPDHLRNNLSDCFLVAAQAIRWNMDPFAVAQHTYVVKGKLGYEGKLIAAMINTHRRVDGGLHYRYSGAGQQRSIIVSGSLRGDSKVREVEGSFASWHTKGKEGAVSDQWLRDPDQMLAYRGARQWARRYMPEVVLGVLSDDEVKAEVVDLEPQADGSFGQPVEPPSPARRLEDLAEKLKFEPPPKAEVTSIIEGQLKKSIEREKLKRDVREPGEDG